LYPVLRFVDVHTDTMSAAAHQALMKDAGGLLPKKAFGLHAAWTIASSYALDHPLMMPFPQ